MKNLMLLLAAILFTGLLAMAQTETDGNKNPAPEETVQAPAVEKPASKKGCCPGCTMPCCAGKENASKKDCTKAQKKACKEAHKSGASAQHPCPHQGQETNGTEQKVAESPKACAPGCTKPCCAKN